MISERSSQVWLVAVVAVIVLVFVIVQVGEFAREAREFALKADLQRIRRAVDFYYTRTNTYPDTVERAASKGYGKNVTLLLRNVDAGGRARDPFGRRYLYNPATGEVRSRTPGYDKY